MVNELTFIGVRHLAVIRLQVNFVHSHRFVSPPHKLVVVTSLMLDEIVAALPNSGDRFYSFVLLKNTSQTYVCKCYLKVFSVN